MLNKVHLIGHLGKDPELRYTAQGDAVATMSLATDESYTDRNGQKVERTEWHRVVVFKRTAEACAQHLHKGSLTYVEGKLATREWQDQNGQKRFTTEIRAERVQFLDKKENGTQGGAGRAEYNNPGGFPEEPRDMDFIPF